MSRNRIDNWLARELEILIIIHEIVAAAEEEAEEYDSIDFLIDLLASTVISTVEEYLFAEYDDAFRTDLMGLVAAEPEETARRAAVYDVVDGKTFAERIEEYAAEGFESFESKIASLVATDGHRVRSEGTLAAGETLAEADFIVEKIWNIIDDGKARDAHSRLKGVTVPFYENFKIDGYSTPAPGLFGVAELDCNCRCWLTLKVRRI